MEQRVYDINNDKRQGPPSERELLHVLIESNQGLTAELSKTTFHVAQLAEKSEKTEQAVASLATAISRLAVIEERNIEQTKRLEQIALAVEDLKKQHISHVSEDEKKWSSNSTTVAYGKGILAAISFAITVSGSVAFYHYTKTDQLMEQTKTHLATDKILNKDDIKEK